MAKTYQNLIDEARTLNQDTVVDSYRNEDPVYLDKLNRALQELARIRPDAFWSTYDDVIDDITVPELTDTDLDDFFEPPMQFYFPVVAFVVGQIEMIEDEFSADGRAMAMLGTFKASVVSL